MGRDKHGPLMTVRRTAASSMIKPLTLQGHDWSVCFSDMFSLNSHEMTRLADLGTFISQAGNCQDKQDILRMYLCHLIQEPLRFLHPEQLLHPPIRVVFFQFLLPTTQC